MINYTKLSALTKASTPLVVVSLSHMTDEDTTFLNQCLQKEIHPNSSYNLNHHQYPCIYIGIGVFHPFSDGEWILHIFPEKTSLREGMILSSALLDLIETCRMSDFYWLKFSRDADELPEFKSENQKMYSEDSVMVQEPIHHNTEGASMLQSSEVQTLPKPEIETMSEGIHRMNEERADDAEFALKQFQQKTEMQGESVSTVMHDFLVAMRHACDRHGITFHRLLSQATKSYQTDLDDCNVKASAMCIRRGNAMETFV